MICPKPWSVYLIACSDRTYVGSTTDMRRRLRQHNGEIVGGARSTRGKHWTLILYVTGFSGRGEALRWERIVKMRARGLHQRHGALLGLPGGVCPVKRGRRQYEVPTNLKIGEMK